MKYKKENKMKSRRHSQDPSQSEVDEMKDNMRILEVKEKLAKDYHRFNEKTKIKNKFPLNYNTLEAKNPVININDEEYETYCCGFFRKKNKVTQHYRFDDLKLNYSEFRKSGSIDSGGSRDSFGSVKSFGSG